MSTPPDRPQEPSQGRFPPPPPAGSSPSAGASSPGAAPSGSTSSGATPPGSTPGSPPPAGPPPGYGQHGGYGAGGTSGGYATPAYGAGAPLSESDQRMWAVLSHALTLLVGFLAPLVIWLVFKGRGAFSEDHSRESLNFQITMTLVAILLSFVTVVTLGIGGLLYLPLVVFIIVFVIIAAVKASQGQPYRYPLTLRLIK